MQLTTGLRVRVPPTCPGTSNAIDSKRAQCLQYMACLGAVIGYTSGLQVCAVLHTAVAKYTVICCRCCRHAAASHQRCGMHALNTVIAAQTGRVRRGCAAAEAATCIIRKHVAAQQPYYMQAAPAACEQRESHRNAHSWNNSHDTTNRQVHQHPAAEF